MSRTVWLILLVFSLHRFCACTQATSYGRIEEGVPAATTAGTTGATPEGVGGGGPAGGGFGNLGNLGSAGDDGAGDQTDANGSGLGSSAGGTSGGGGEDSGAGGSAETGGTVGGEGGATEPGSPGGQAGSTATAATGGAPGSGGTGPAAGTGGAVAATGGTVGPGGVSGAAGAGGRESSGQMGGMGGATRTGPCAGQCFGVLSATVDVLFVFGIDPLCAEVTTKANGIVCGSVEPSRPFTVNGKPLTCGGQGQVLPAPRAGGYCVVSPAGLDPDAYFRVY